MAFSGDKDSLKRSQRLAMQSSDFISLFSFPSLAQTSVFRDLGLLSQGLSRTFWTAFGVFEREDVLHGVEGQEKYTSLDLRV